MCFCSLCIAFTMLFHFSNGDSYGWDFSLAVVNFGNYFLCHDFTLVNGLVFQKDGRERQVFMVLIILLLELAWLSDFLLFMHKKITKLAVLNLSSRASM